MSDELFPINLGDIILIDSTNNTLHQQTFLIEFINQTKCKLINIKTLERIELPIHSDHLIGDGQIRKITVVNRTEKVGFASQYNLIKGTWLNIYFGGETVFSRTALITNVIEDMIELKTSVYNETFYINFDYKGIPEELNITRIEIRSPPQKKVLPKINIDNEVPLEEVVPLIDEPKVEEPPEMMIEDNPEDLDYNIYLEDDLDEGSVQSKQNELLQNANVIIDDIIVDEYVITKSSLWVFPLEEQLISIQDDFLSKIPTHERNPKVFQHLNTVLNRFLQLRSSFSTFGDYNVASGKLKSTPLFNPLKTYLTKFNENPIYWLVPVVTLKRKVFVDDDTDDDPNDNTYYYKTDPFTDIRNLYRELNNPRQQNDHVSQFEISQKKRDEFLQPFSSFSGHDLTAPKPVFMNNVTVHKDTFAIIDNFTKNQKEFYSDVISKTEYSQSQYVFQQYVTGRTDLEYINNIDRLRMNVIRVNKSENEKMSIKGFLTLPLSVILFSRVNMNNTSILERAVLSKRYFRYHQLFDDSLKIVKNEIQMNPDKNHKYDSQYTFNLNEVQYHTIPNIENENIPDHRLYQTFVENIAPRIITLIHQVSQYMKPMFTFSKFVDALEPFLIYSHNITYSQYKSICKMVRLAIRKHRATFSTNDKSMGFIKKAYVQGGKEYRQKIVKNPVTSSIVQYLIDANKVQLHEKYTVFDFYGIQNIQQMQNVEVFQYLLHHDGMVLYTSLLALQTSYLTSSDNLKVKIVNALESVYTKQEEISESDNSCPSIRIVKKYFSILDLQKDNGINVKVDKEYDKTNYVIIEKYENEIKTMEMEALKSFIIKDFVSQNYSAEDAKELVDTILNGFQPVKDGDYAVLRDTDTILKQAVLQYYVRDKKVWVLDEKLSKEFQPELCYSSKNCTMNENLQKCIPTNVDINGTTIDFLRKMMNNVENEYMVSVKQYKEYLTNEVIYNQEIIGRKLRVKEMEKLQHDYQKQLIALNGFASGNVAVISPHRFILSKILGLNDFDLQQQYIIMFVQHYTREPMKDINLQTGILESENWLYCKDTNVQLLPIFKYKLAIAYHQDNYESCLDEIIKTNGKKCDDDNGIVDKFSGWQITHIDFSTEDEFNAGVKVVNRSVIQMNSNLSISKHQISGVELVMVDNEMDSDDVEDIDPENIDTNQENQTNDDVTLQLETITIDETTDTKLFIMGVIHKLIQLLNTTVSRTDYTSILNNIYTNIQFQTESEFQKSKEMQTFRHYSVYKALIIIYYSVSVLFIYLQTQKQRVFRRRRIQDCLESYDGYPLKPEISEINGITFMACSLNSISKSKYQWNIFKDMKSKQIAKKLTSFIKHNFVENTENQEIYSKIITAQHDLENKMTEDIQNNYSVVNSESVFWKQFLPPLHYITLDKEESNVESQFMESILQNIKQKKKEQRDQQSIIESKIVSNSIHIVAKINNIISKEPLLLFTKSDITPFTENACCNRRSENINSFVTQKDVSIRQHQDTIQSLQQKLLLLTMYNKSAFIDVELKNYAISLSTQSTYKFGETIMYTALIHYCKFDSFDEMIPDHLLPALGQIIKPDASYYNPSDNIQNKIQALKGASIYISEEMFLKLMQYVHGKHITNLNSTLRLKDSTVLPICNAIDSRVQTMFQKYSFYDGIQQRSVTPIVPEDIDYVYNKIVKIQMTIQGFISNSKYDIKSLTKWSNSTMFKELEFYKTFCVNFIHHFPLMIINSSECNTIARTKPLKKLSDWHVNKLQSSLDQYYTGFDFFYGNEKIKPLLEKVNAYSSEIQQVVSSVCYMGDTSSKSNDYMDLLMILMRYMMLNSLQHIIELAKEVNSLYSHNQEKKEDIQKLVMTFLNVAMEHKKIIGNIDYDRIKSKTFQYKTNERNRMTDRLGNMKDDVREVNTMMKRHKLGEWRERDVVNYNKLMYAEEQELREENEGYEYEIDIGDGPEGVDSDNDD